MAVANYHDIHGSLPPAYIADADGKPMHSWRVLILPYLEHQGLYDQYDFSEPWDGPNNRRLLDQRPEIFGFSDNASSVAATTNYLAVVGNETAWPRGKSMKMRQIGDGTGRTILIVENHGGGIQWTEPRDLDLATMSLKIGAESTNGISSRYDPPAVVTVEGRVNKLSMELSPKTLRALLTANGGEKIPLDTHFKEIPDGRDRPMKDEK